MTVNIIVALLLILTYFSVYISPEKTIAVALLPFIYVGLTVLNLFFAIIWLILKWKYSFISFVTVLAGIKFISLVFPFSTLFSTSDTSADFKIMSYNVMVFGFYNWDNNQQIKNNIISSIEQENPDILCLQEAYWNNSNQNFITLSPIMQKIGAEDIHQVAMATAVGGQNFGLVTISKYPIVNEYAQKFDKSFNGYIYSDIVINSDTVRVFNVHLQSIQLNQNDYTLIEEFAESDDNTKIKIVVKKYLSSLKTRALQAEMVRASIDSCSYPVFVCGDFNDGPLTYTYFTISEGLKDTFVSKGKYPGYTWDNFNIKQRIDYILFDKKFSCKSHKIIKTTDSDHFAIVAGFVNE